MCIQLPRVLIVLLDADVMNIASYFTHENMESLLQFLIGQLVETLQK